MAKEPSQEFITQLNQAKGILYKVIRLYVQDADDEEDLFQEIIYQAWKSYPSFEGKSKFSTWLYRIALNTVLTFKRRVKLVTPVEDLTSIYIVDETPKAETELLYLAIRSLNEIDRMIITLHLDGYDNEEIGSISGLSKNNVAVKLFRIREALTKKVKTL
ncbi:MAG: RNA polymerase sigma factor [Cyclobacteriaceae bacterium]|jgi:RNA polymerase sigma-70 factor (ECF subfamily)|nr:RNA polymerase sigma factor [Cytophagales bacterium]MCZ8329364.1 RNA polymerase sigma factor [Cyclobacteriaceae bacterium]